MWTKARLVQLTMDRRVLFGGAFLLGSLSGSVGGYISAKNRLKTKYERISEQEIDDAKRFYSRLYKKDEQERPLSPEEVLEKLHGVAAVDAMKSYQGLASTVEAPVQTEEELEETPPSRSPVIGKSVKQNIFKKNSPVDEWDYAVELRAREEYPNRPYILSHDEYFEGEKEYEQISLTYFEGDDVLSDDKDVPVDDVEATVGDDNLVRFGYGSKDNNVLYIRNDRLEMDFEIVRSTGKYQVEVLGFDDPDSLKHSHRPGIRKFRERDE